VDTPPDLDVAGHDEREQEMPMRPEFLLGESEFNDFLFASVLDEKNGQELTVVSLLARLDLNPWEEAARLSGLTAKIAVDELAVMITKQSAEDLPPSETQSIAARLVGFLPKRRGQPAGSRQPGVVEHGTRWPGNRRLLQGVIFLQWFVVAVAVIMTVWSLSGS